MVWFAKIFLKKTLFSCLFLECCSGMNPFSFHPPLTLDFSETNMQNANKESESHPPCFFVAISFLFSPESGFFWRKMVTPCHTFKWRITSAPFCWLKQIPKIADSKCLSIDGTKAL